MAEEEEYDDGQEFLRQIERETRDVDMKRHGWTVQPGVTVVPDESDDEEMAALFTGLWDPMTVQARREEKAVAQREEELAAREALGRRGWIGLMGLWAFGFVS
jgi:hypothetical protein